MANEKRLIDAKKYAESIGLTMRCWSISPALSPAEAKRSVDNLRTALHILNQEPTVDAVEVVRCKNCEFFRPGEDGIYYCYRKKREYGVFMRNDDFCSYGKRKEVNREAEP